MSAPLTLKSMWGSITKTGPWQVPAVIDATSTMGSITLDFTAADCSHESVEVHVNCQAGKIVLVVPDGWAVDTDELRSNGAGVAIALGRQPQPGMPRLRVTGQVTWGRLEITDLESHPSQRDERAERRRARDERHAARRFDRDR